MAEYIYPLATLVLDFFCILLCIRYAITRRGVFWLGPTILSLILLLGSLVCLLATASQMAGPTISSIASFVSIFLFAISSVWLIVIVALGRKMKPQLNDAAFDEAQYLKMRATDIPEPISDPRPTASSRISKASGHEKRAPLDLYEQGPVRTLRPKRVAR